MIVIWGLKNCDSCRKALKWLEAEGLPHQFKDVRKDGLETGQLETWVEGVGLDLLVNRRGTSWRGLSEEVKDSLNVKNAPALLQDQPALMKRPIWEMGREVRVGFTDDVKKELMSFCK